VRYIRFVYPHHESPSEKKGHIQDSCWQISIEVGFLVLHEKKRAISWVKKHGKTVKEEDFFIKHKMPLNFVF